MKAIETYYNGYRFRSRLEARWAVFFDTLGVKYEYEPEGFDLGDGLYYLPDFRVKCWGDRDTWYMQPEDLYIEVKGVLNFWDEKKIDRFVYGDPYKRDCHFEIKNKLLLVGNIPDKRDEFTWIGDTRFNSFEYIDNDCYFVIPTAYDGRFFLGAGDYNYNEELTSLAYEKAREARFEYGESG